MEGVQQKQWIKKGPKTETGRCAEGENKSGSEEVRNGKTAFFRFVQVVEKNIPLSHLKLCVMF